MPIPAPGNVDVASQTTLNAVKAKTDNLPASPASQTTLLTQGYTSRLAPVISNQGAGAKTIYIQPPVGETWVIYVSAILVSNAANSWMGINYYDGATAYGIGAASATSAGNLPRAYVGVWMRITNTMYAQLTCTVGNDAFSYAYWGWKE